MAFLLNMDTEATVSIIVSKDSAIKHVSEETYEKYLETLDESLLELPEGAEPTRFILKKVLPYKDTKRVMNSQVSFDDGKPNVNISFILDEVSCALDGMTGPGAESFEKINNRASHKLVNALYNQGVLMDLYNGRRNATGEGDSEVPKKS